MLKSKVSQQEQALQEQADASARQAEGEKILERLVLSQTAFPHDRIDEDGWPDTDAHFAGWAPTVSSRFTFSMVGEPQKDNRTANLEEADGTRRVAHLAERTTRDAFIFSPVRRESSYYCYMVGETMPAHQLRPNIATRLGLEPEGGEVHQVIQRPQPLADHVTSPTTGACQSTNVDQPTVLKSVEAEHGKLTGFVTFFVKRVTKGSNTKASKNRRKLHKNLHRKITQTIAEISKTTRETGRFRTWTGDRSFIDTAMLPVKELLDQAGDFHALTIVRYEIHRSGEVRLFLDRAGLPKIISFPLTKAMFEGLPKEWKQERSAERDYIEPYAFQDGSKYVFEAHRDAFFRGNADEFLRHQLTRMVEPIFDFLRDTIHKHYHHEPVDDRMVNVRRVTKSTDHKWRLDTLQWLMTTVQRRRRRGKEPHLRDALGILSYVEAFQRQLAAHKRCEKSYSKFEENVDLRPHALGHLERSLRTELDRRIKNRTTNQQIVLIITTVLVAVIAAVQATIGSEGVLAPPANWVGLTAEFSKAHPAASVAAWTTLAATIAVGIYEAVSERLTYGKLLYSRQSFVNTILGAIAASSQRGIGSNIVARLFASGAAFATALGLIAVMYWSFSTFVRHIESTSSVQSERSQTEPVTPPANPSGQ